MGRWRDDVSRIGNAVPIVLVAGFATSTLVLDHMDGVALFGLGLFGIALWVFGKCNWRELPYSILVMSVAAALLPFLGELSMLVNPPSEIGIRMLGRLGRWFLFVPVAFALWRVRYLIAGRVIGRLLLSGSVAAAIVAVFQVFIAGRQATGATGVAIVFGDVIAIQTFLGLCFLLSGRWNRWDRLVAWVGGAAGLVSVVLSGSRGAIILFVVLGITLAYVYLRGRPVRLALVAACVLGICFIAVKESAVLQRRYLGGLREAVALRTNPFNSNIRKASLLLCPDSERTLGRLISRSVIGSASGHGRIEIVRATSLGSDFPWLGCAGGAAIAVENVGEKGWYVVHFPRAVSIGKVSPAVVVAEGTGRFKVVGSGKSGEAILTGAAPQIVTIGRKVPQAGYLTVVLRPKEHITFIPIQATPGEYVFPRDQGSLAKRLWLWQVALEAFLERPFRGIGLGGFRSRTMQLASAGELPSYLAGTYEHPHNDFLWMLEWGGMPAGIVYLAIVLFPAFSAPYGKSRSSGDLTFCRVAGIGLSAAVLIGGLTETLFSHALFNSWLAIMGLLTLMQCHALKYGSDEHRWD